MGNDRRLHEAGRVKKPARSCVAVQAAQSVLPCQTMDGRAKESIMICYYDMASHTASIGIVISSHKMESLVILVGFAGGRRHYP